LLRTFRIEQDSSSNRPEVGAQQFAQQFAQQLADAPLLPPDFPATVEKQPVIY